MQRNAVYYFTLTINLLITYSCAIRIIVFNNNFSVYNIINNKCYLRNLRFSLLNSFLYDFILISI